MNRELVAKELATLKDANGELHPQRVVDFARTHPKCECHKGFNWDIEAAANAYWLQQARYLIQNCVVVTMDPNDGRTEIRAWFSEGGTDPNYRSTEVMIQDSDQRSTIITRTLQRVLGILDSYPLPELRPVAASARKLLQKYQTVKETVSK